MIAIATEKVDFLSSGDSLQATDSSNYAWGAPQDVKLSLKYPRSGTGATISYIQIDVEQSTNIGQAYVLDGGIGQKKVSLIVEGNQTLTFKYKADIFGTY